MEPVDANDREVSARQLGRVSGAGISDTIFLALRQKITLAELDQGGAMAISSRTPEEEPAFCPVCCSELKVDAPASASNTPCPRCGYLQWFTWANLGDVGVIRPTGKLLERESLDSFLRWVAIKPGVRLVLELGEVRFFSSAVLSKLIELKRRVASVGGQFTIRQVDPEVLDIFRIARLDHIFDIEA
jgi:anti-anti-sigma factor